MKPLYIAPAAAVFEKNASEVTLPEDANSWSNEIMQELFKQIPYIADFDPEVVMDRVDAERGYGFGHVEVKNKTELQSGASQGAQDAVGVHLVRIPVIIKDRKLFPFDVLVTADSKMLPLNESRVRQALFRPQAFDVTSRTPGDMSMVGQLYPPYRQNFGGGGGGGSMGVGMGKEGSYEPDLRDLLLAGQTVYGGALGGIAGYNKGRDSGEGLGGAVTGAVGGGGGALLGGLAGRGMVPASGQEAGPLAAQVAAQTMGALGGGRLGYDSLTSRLHRGVKEGSAVGDAKKKCASCGSLEKCGCMGKQSSSLEEFLLSEKNAFTAVEGGAVLGAGGAALGGLAGYLKGRGTGEGASGAARGALGGGLGAGAGALGGFLSGIPDEGTLASTALGGLAGYKAMTHGIGRGPAGELAGYNHYADHMNELIAAEGGSMDPAVHDHHTRAYNAMHGTNHPLVSDEMEMHPGAQIKQSGILDDVKRKAMEHAHEVGQASQAASAAAGDAAGRAAVSGAASELSGLARAGKEKVLGLAKEHGGKALAAAGGLYAANKGVNYAIDRHRDKKMVEDLRKKGSASVPNSTAAKSIGPKIHQMVPKLGSILEAILPTINVEDHLKFAEALEEPSLRALYVHSRTFTGPACSKLAQYEPASHTKTAAVVDSLMRPDVVQVTKLASGYQIKVASSQYWQPVSREADRGMVVRMFGEKVALAADTTGAVTMSEGEAVVGDSTPESRPELISSFGLYRVKNMEGQELVGFVFPNLLDTDGTALPIALFTNGSETALQDAVVGELVGKDSGLVFGPSTGHGMFVNQLPNGSADAMVPMTIKAGYSEGGSRKMHVETYDGREMFVELQPNIQKPTDVDGTCIIPANYKWMPLGGDEVVLVSSPDGWGQAKAASSSFAQVVVRAGGENSFSLEGPALRKIASDERSFLSLDDTLFMFAGMGTDLNYAAEKIAEAIATFSPVSVPISRHIKLASDVREEAAASAAEKLAHVPNLRCSLIKEAAFVPDPGAVDTVLSVGFINPENIMTFVSYLPQLDQSQGRLCELLVAARMGLSDVPTSPLEKCIRSLEGVIDGLKVLAFSKS